MEMQKLFTISWNPDDDEIDIHVDNELYKLIKRALYNLNDALVIFNERDDD